MEPKFPLFNPLYVFQPYLNVINNALLSQQMGGPNVPTPQTTPGAFPYGPLPPPNAATAALARRLAGPLPLDLALKPPEQLISPSGRPLAAESDLLPKMSPQQLAAHLNRNIPAPIGTGGPGAPITGEAGTQNPAAHRSSPSTSPRNGSQSSEALSKHTLQSTKWAINVWNTWASQKNNRLEQAKSSHPKIPTIPELSKVKSEDLDIFLSEFISEVRRFDGEMYPPDSLMVLCAGVQRFLREDGNRPDLSFLDGYDKDYPKFQSALGQVVKDLQDRGIGTVKRKADTFNQEMEKELWNKGVLSFHSPKGLSRAVYFYITKGFWLRSRGDHRNLLVEDLHFGADNYGQYVELAQRYYHPKKEQTVARKSQPVRHYNVDQKICKVFAVLSYYCKLIPPHGPLYRKPIEERLDGKTALFGSAAIGVHALERIPSELATEAGFDGYFTSRSVWVSDIPCQCNKYVMLLKSSSVLPLNLSGAAPPAGIRGPHPPTLLPLNFNPSANLPPHFVNPVSLASIVSQTMLASKLPHPQNCNPNPIKEPQNHLNSGSSVPLDVGNSREMETANVRSSCDEMPNSLESRKRKLSLTSPISSTASSLVDTTSLALFPKRKQEESVEKTLAKPEALERTPFGSRPLDLSQRLNTPDSDSDAESSDVEIDDDRLSMTSPLRQNENHDGTSSQSVFPNLEKHVSVRDHQLLSDVLNKNQITAVSVVEENKSGENKKSNLITLKIFYE